MTLSEGLGLATQAALLISVCVGIGVQLRTQVNVRKIEVATNSMKDALIEATALSSGLEGEKRGRQAEKDERG